MQGVPPDNVIRIMISNKIQESEQGRSKMLGLEQNAELEKLEKQADRELANGNLDRAISILARVMAMRKTLLKMHKASGLDSTSVRYDTACVLEKLGELLTSKGDKVHAERAFTDALKLFQKVGQVSRCDRIEVQLAMIHSDSNQADKKSSE